jgi:lipoate-protein ligase A
MSEQGKKRQKESAAKVLSYREMVTWLMTHKKCPERDEVIRYLIEAIRNINGNGGYVTVNMTKEIYLEFEAIRAKYKLYKKYL